MITDTSSQVEADCLVLLNRALHGKRVCAFGEDGLGSYGRNERAYWYTVRNLVVDLGFDDVYDPNIVTGTARIFLDGYDADVVGLILTDKNFEICIRELLKAAQIDPGSLVWPEEDSEQGDTYVTMNIDIALLLGWT